MKKTLSGLFGISLIIIWLSVDEKISYLGSITLITALSIYNLFWSIPQRARNTKFPQRAIKIFLNLGFGFFFLFLSASSEIADFNFYHNSKFVDGEVTSIIKSQCRSGLRRKSRRLVDCWKIETTAGGDIFISTSFIEDEYNLGSKRYILVAGQVEDDFIKFNQIPLIGSLHTRINQEIFDEKFDQKTQYFESLKSNFGFVGIAFSISLILFGLRWISLISTSFEPSMRPTVQNKFVSKKRDLTQKNYSQKTRVEPKITREKN